MASVDDIKSMVGRRGGFAKPNRFRVNFSALSTIAEINAIMRSASDAKDMNFLCDSCTIPGRTLTTTDFSTWNHPIKIPSGGYDEDDIEMMFNVTNDYLVKRVFDAWLDKVVSQDDYLVGYDSDYKRDIVISHLDDQDRVIYEATIQGAFPISVKGVALDNNSESTVSKFSTTITFDRFRIKKPELLKALPIDALAVNARRV